ncbi:hypothetical protein GOP47_0019453 [Adiantum capillus-veneris]|uniref:Protein kinase domain-containing protein n=1 Tax=Adiantum capillus-veneris TaxID=13818 RepID=A0A9D4UC21_ADICA|nr:hypothetical protein GOP47_0019453 [Adiantum capillus-veneris]
MTLAVRARSIGRGSTWKGNKTKRWVGGWIEGVKFEKGRWLHVLVLLWVQQEEVDRGVRMMILVGVVTTLEYLHERSGKRVLHRVVEATNVMLTEGFEARLGDFG